MYNFVGDFCPKGVHEENKIGSETEPESETNFPKTPVLKPAPDPKIKSFSLISKK